MIKAVIFDMDGLIVDTETLYSIAMNEVAQRRGKRFTIEIKRAMMGRPGIESMEIFKKYLNLIEPAEQLLNEREEIYGRILESAQLVPMSGFLTLLEFIEQQGMVKAIASSSPACWIEIVTRKLSVTDRFNVIVSGDDVKNGKPCPEIYLLASKKLQVLPEECIALEDTTTGVEAAKRAGMMCIGVPNQYSQGLDFSKADMVVNSLDEVKDIIMNIC
jgi:HAD superfamily hydrolase (TIGR01509 family)